MTARHDEQDRRDARTVETTFAVFLGVATFLALAFAGWLIDHLLRTAFGLSLAPAATALLLVATVASAGVTVGHLVRARRRGL